jgi:hypothetical protein
MSLEQFLKNQWHVRNAYHLIKWACYILTFLEKQQETYANADAVTKKRERHSGQYHYLERKEKYNELYKELDSLVDKLGLRENINVQDSGSESEEEEDLYDVLKYKRILEDSDKLVARDITWDKEFHDEC